MEKVKNIEIVQQLYADVGGKNLPGVLDALTDDIRWEPPFTSGIPHTKLRIGKNEVTNFVIEMASEVTYTEFVPQDFFADGNVVIVKGFFKGTVNQNGKPFESDWVHIWKFRGEKIFDYQSFYNTNNLAIALN